MADGKIPEEFEIGEPVLVCRWRLSVGELPAANRHIRALSWRMLPEGRPTKQLVGWAKQHIEWTLREGSAAHPDGVLMIMVDELGRAAMAVGDYEPLEDTSLAALAARALAAREEAAETDVAPETLWVARAGSLVAGLASGEHESGASSLVADLAKTLGISVSREAGLAQEVASGEASFDEAFLVSDEHGVVCATDARGPMGKRFSDGWGRLLDASNRPGGSAHARRQRAN